MPDNEFSNIGRETSEHKVDSTLSIDPLEDQPSIEKAQINKEVQFIKLRRYASRLTLFIIIALICLESFILICLFNFPNINQIPQLIILAISPIAAITLIMFALLKGIFHLSDVKNSKNLPTIMSNLSNSG